MQTIIITGAAQGIGYFTAQWFLSEFSNYNIVIVDVKEPSDKESLMKEYNDRLLIVQCDVSNESQVSNMIEQTMNKFNQIDALVNNAAISNPYNTELQDLSFEEWNRVINVNLNSLFLTCKYCIPHLKKTKGTIINLSSTRSMMSEPNSEAYSTTKGGVLAFSHSLANSVGKYGVRVNSISPGWIDTTGGKSLRPIDHEQHLTGRVGKPIDIAKMIKYLVDDVDGFITGQNFVIDGGMTVKMIYAEE
jgi:NAD(P)-dependent dehydrogenase (short-subunit alcohol dehydrogenase family)